MTSKPVSRDRANGDAVCTPSSLDAFDGGWAIALTAAALLLYLMALGDVPLRDWDEGTRAAVAREIFETGQWWHPTQFGQPYMLKPPLMDWWVALSFHCFGVTDWAARIPGAVASALGVPLLYLLGRSQFQRRPPALCSAAVLLTLLPVVRHGRLLMLDGMAVSAFLAMLLCLARETSHPRWGIGVGLSLGWLGLTKGLLAVPLGGIALAWVLLRRQRSLFTNGWVVLGGCVGLAALAAWYAGQFHHYGWAFGRIHFLAQGFNRLSETVESHSGPVWYYLLEIVKYAWPGLLFWPLGLKLAWSARDCWGGLVLVGTVGYLGMISVMGTKLPWYVMPVYPFVALAVGAQLAWYWQSPDRISRGWAFAFAGLGAIALAGSVYFAIDYAGEQWVLPLMGLVLSGTFAIVARLLWQKRRRFIPIFFAGIYASLLLLMLSGEWLWELNEAFDVLPVAELVRSQVPANTILYTSFGYERPSLNYYSHCKILPASPQQLQERWANHYLLLERLVWQQFSQTGVVPVASTSDFVLLAPQVMSSGLSGGPSRLW
ncbi:MAG: ArnT family glycosyltransferase [Synechococcus sp.]